MELQITTLIENEVDDEGVLSFEHGLSLYIEFQGKKILFDTGQTGAFFENAGKLGKKLEDADYIFISHGHYDHSGGVPKLMEYLKCQEGKGQNGEVSKNTIPFYVGNEFFVSKYKKLPDEIWHYNGNPFSEEDVLKSSLQLHRITEDVTYITDNILVFKNFKRYTDFEPVNSKFFVEEYNYNFRQDEFVDEIALGLITTRGLVMIVGCSHVGIVNILENVTRRTKLPIYAVLGGTHLVEADEVRLHNTMQAFKQFGVREIAVSHCTGEAGIDLARMEFGQGFIRNNTGNVYCV